MDNYLNPIKEIIQSIIINSDLPNSLNFSNDKVLSLVQEKKHFSLYFVNKILFKIEIKKESKVLKIRPEYTSFFNSDSCKRNSANWLDVEISSIEEIKKYDNEILNIIKAEFFCIHGEPFGCCSNFMDCSDHMYCIKDDLLFSLGCQYRQNLLENKIFYGKNRNIQ